MSNEYIEPTKFDEVAYEDNSILIKKICLWEKCELREDWEDRETNLLKVLLPVGKYFNVGCIGTYVLPDGTRATELEFSYIDDFHEGLAKIAVKDKGYGFIDDNTILPIEYKSISISRKDDLIIARNDKGSTLYRIIRKG